MTHGKLTTRDSAPATLPGIILGVTAVWVAFVLATRTDFVPFWDGRVYADCIIDAALAPSLRALRCAGHASQVYVAYAALIQAVRPESYVPMLAGNAALLVLAAVAFHVLAKQALPTSSLATDRALVTAAFVVQPALMGATLQPGIDLPLLPAFLSCLTLLLGGRRVAAALVGLALCFTKETGVLLYAVLLACFIIWSYRGPVSELPVRERARRWIVLAVPLVAFSVYLLVRTVKPAGAVLWNTSSTGESLLHQFLVPRIDLHLVKYLALVFVASFAWVPAFVLLADGFVGMARAAHRLEARAMPGADQRVVALLTILTLAVGYALTRFTTFGHSRYFLTLTPLILLLSVASLVRLDVPASARRALLAAYVLVLAVSDIRTIDPVSKATYGTFAFGEHRLLRMTSITDECCGAGQDHLAYSAEFTVLGTLLDSALAASGGHDSVAIIVPDSLDWMLIGPLDAKTGRRTLARTGTVRPRVVEHWKIFVGREIAPRSATFIALPTGRVGRALEQLRTIYAVSEPRRFATHGYAIQSYALTLRDSPP